MTSQERYAVNYQVEHLQTKYVGTGHADTTKLCAKAARAARATMPHNVTAPTSTNHTIAPPCSAASGPSTSTATRSHYTWATIPSVNILL
jgi:hypothetical protein